MKKVISISIIALFIFSIISPMSVGFDTGSNLSMKDASIMDYNHHRFSEHYYPEGYFSGQCSTEENIEDWSSEMIVVTNSRIHKPQQSTISGGPMNSPWPMRGHDQRNTGRSPHGTDDNPGFELWRFKTKDAADCSPAIDSDGTIYIGAFEFYAIYPNGTLKWEYDMPSCIETATPAIDENGVIYIGTIWAMPNHLHAIFTSNGTLKWKYNAGNSLESSPAIGSDGTVYFGDIDGNIHAVNPDGTKKWIYRTGSVVTSSPAIGDDGIVYVGSHDDYVYAFYPDNGTVKWKFKTGNWVHGSPTIGDDGTIYIGSDDEYLYALTPNGTMKWRLQIGATWASPSLDENGTLYIGVWQKRFYAINPNGTKKWTYYLGDKDRVWGSTAAISADGTIYFGTSDISGTGPWAHDIVALNPDGSEKWRKFIETSFSSPAIGEDGTVFIGSEEGLRAFGSYNDAPEAPTINGPKFGKKETDYDYNFTTIDPNGNNVYYYIDWGDGDVEEWIGPYLSGEVITLNHTWDKKGKYFIRARAQDINNLLGPWNELKIWMPKTENVWFLNWLDKFPLLRWLLEWLI